MNAVHAGRLPLLVGAGLALISLSPAVAYAQEQPVTGRPDAATVFYACYLPTTGLVYRIKEPGLAPTCRDERHVEFSWSARGHDLVPARADALIPRAPTGILAASPGADAGVGASSIPSNARFAWVPSIGAFSVGIGASASGGYAVALGHDVLANGGSSVALGTNASTNGKSGAFVYGDGMVAVAAEKANSFTVRASGGALFHSPLFTVRGWIESSVGGFKFPDGSLQTTAALRDHGWLTGRDDNDHPQYLLATAAITDHGNLAGLPDDDHSQYLLADGVRNTTNGFAVTGTFATGSIPATGPGTRLMFYPKKAAFRVGYVAGSQWDDGNVGTHSIAMGYGAIASQWASVALGWNAQATGGYATALGGSVKATAGWATAIGIATEASGQYSTALGAYASTNGKHGAFIYGDQSTFITVKSTVNNSFTVRAAGGTTFYSSSNLTTGSKLVAGGGSWSSVSDRAVKENFRDEDGEETLSAIAAMPIQSWNYKTQDPSIRHLGPMAQDFRAAFGLGLDDKHINTVDIDGINMLAVQALEKRTRELHTENERLRERMAHLEAAIRRLEAALAGMLP